MNDNINKIQKILQNKVGYQGSSADLMKYLETPENKEKLVKILNTKVGYEGTVDDFNSYVGIQVPKVEGIQKVSAPSVTVGAPEVNVMSPLASNVPTTPKVDWAAQEEGSITKPISGELEREQPVNFEGMKPDPKNDPDYSVTNQSGKFVYTFDKEKSDRRKEKDAYLTILDEQMKASNKRLEESMAAVKKYNAENPTSGWENFPVAYGGAAFAQHEREKQKITGGEPQGEIFATQAILKDAEKAFKAPKKGENWAKSFGIGGAETVTDPDAWLFGILSLNEVQQSMSVFEKVEKGEPLTDTESAVMDAMLTRTQAEAMRSSDTSNWYKGGKIAGESLPFMRDMALTGGLSTITTAGGKGAVSLAQKATAKYLRKKAEKQLLKEGIDITEDILSRRAADLFMRTAKVADYSGRVLAASTVTPAARLPLMPTSYSGVAKNIQPKVVGDEFGTYQIQEGDDFGTAVGKQFVEVQSEGVGEFFAPILKGVKLLGGKAIPKIISDSKFGQVGSKVVDAIMLDNPYLQKAGVSGIAGEVGEEIFGQTEQYLSGLTTKEDLDNFYSGDNFKSMLIGFAPMSALGIAGNAINYGSNEVQYRRAKKELGGITDELDNTSVGELGNKISDILIQNNAFDQDGNLTEEGRQLNNNLVSYAQRKMAKDIANDGKQENPNSRYYDFLLNDRSKKWLESYLADNDLTAPMYFNLAYKATLHENELTDYERKTLSELDRAFNGYLKAEDAAQKASAEIDTQVNPTNNKIQNVMVGGQPHMVKGGNIVMTENEEGKVILDKENSDQVITVVNAEGIPSQIGIEQLESVVGEVDAEEAKNAAIESAHTTAYNETFYPVGSIVYRKDAQGQFSAIKETGADGFIINSVTEGGEAVPTLIENTNSENFGVISLKAGDKYTLNDGTQLDIISNEGGVISASVNGQPSEQTTADELATLFESTGIDLAQFEPVVEEVVETPKTEVQVPGAQAEETQATEQTEATYPTDKKGEPIFEQMPVEQSIKVVREVLGDDAVNFVEDKLKAANKAVKAVAKKAPKSTSLLGRKAEVEAIALEKQKATESLDYWTNVKRLMSEEAIQATREQTPTNQVVENPNQVGQVIIDRYESAKKVIGNSATITAPNGEVLKGRYVLVSAYAVTPSHNPFDGYNTSEGFPLNADGSNANQRDYKNDKANQVVTEGIANSFGGQALESVPKVSKDGVVLDGNGRTIASQLAAANGTDKAYLEALNNNAANYGFTAADLKSVSNPRIVFELETELPYTTEAFAMFNSEEKKSESATASAVAKSKQLSPSSVAKIAALVDSYSSLESFFSSETATAEMVKTLVDAKVINTLEIAKLIDNGLFSATGRELITNLLLGATLNEQAIRQIGNDSSLKGIIVRAMKQILENAKLKEYSLFEDINNAIGLMYEARKAKMSVSDFLLQTNMFEKGASERFSDFEQMLALAMSDSGVLFKGTIDKYNTVAAPLVGGQVDMFTGRILDPNEVKQQIIEYYGKTKSIINPNAGVDGRNRGSETTGTGRTGSGRISLESAQAKFDAATTTEEKYKAALEITLILDEQNNTKTIVAKDNEDFISMLPTEWSEIIRVKVVAGVFFKGNVIINAEKVDTGEELTLVYEHEYAHKANRNVHSSNELVELWNNSTDKKILPRDYLGSADNVKGDELIAHIIEDIIQKQGYENYKNGNIDLSLYSQQEQLKKTIDYANKEYLRNARGGNSKGNLYEDNNARKGNENLQQADEGRQTPKFRQKDQGELTEVERNVQGDVSQGGSRVLQPVTTETLLIDGVERPTRNSNGAYIHSTEEGVRNFYAWFNNSKVLDNQGRPLVVYHGSGADFNEFKLDKASRTGASEGYGFYFTDNNKIAKGYQKEGGRLFDVYLSIKKPIDKNQSSFNRSELKKLIKSAVDIEIAKYSDEISDYKDTFLSNIADTYSTSLSKSIDEAVDMLQNNDNAIDQIAELANIMGSEELAFLAVTDSLGYDGIYVKDFQKGEGNLHLAWYPTQIKSATDNTGEFNPETSDIRFKIAKSQEELDDFVKDSKVKGTVYHGTEEGGFQDFLEGAPIWFTPNVSYAEAFKSSLKSGKTYKVRINIKKPLYIGDIDGISNDSRLSSLSKTTNISMEVLKDILEESGGINIFNITKSEEFKELVENQGYDGLEAREGRTTSYAVFSNDQILIDPKEDIRFKIQDEKSQTTTDIPEIKQKQLEIITAKNPMLDNYHTGIRTVSDIKTLQETVDDKEWSEYEYFNPDYTKSMAQKAIETGKITVYSSYPIKQGEFVSPSKMEAESYSGNGKVYSKEVNISDIAWIDPTQGQYASVSDDPRFSIKSPIGFYSTVENALDKIQQEKGTKEQFQKMLLNNGAKQAEMDWMGFDELPEKLTKADIQNWIDENRIEVEEVEKGDVSKDYEISRLEAERLFNNGDEVYGIYDNGGESLIESEEDLMAFNRFTLEQNIPQTESTKYSRYVLPGGENYKELLLTMPEKKSNRYELFDTNVGTWKIKDTQTGEIKSNRTFENKKDAQDLVDNLNNDIETPKHSFHSSHFEEPNILAHIRFDERTVNGERVLFVQEFQSDWNQSIKKKGIKQGYDKKSLSEVPEERYKEMGVSPEKFSLIKFENENGQEEQVFQILKSQYPTIEDAINYISTSKVRNDGEPDNPFKKTDQWVNLALRRMLRWAAENSTPGNSEWISITKPQSVREQLDNNLSSELAAIIPLKVMDIPVLLATKDNEIRRQVIQSIPIDVMNILPEYGIMPESLFSKGYVFSDIVPIEARSSIARGLTSALQLVGTRLRAAFDRILSSDTSRRNEEVLPAISARQLDPSIIVGLLSPSRIYGVDGNNSVLRHSGTLPTTELPVTGINNALVSRKWSSAELASLLNWHDNLINSSSNTITKFVPNTGFDRLAWANGTQQADRYDLSKQVDKINYVKLDNGKYGIDFVEKGKEIFTKAGEYDENQLDDIVGKEIAKKIINGEGKNIKGENLKSLTGLDLKVGGEGMKAFYDAIVPSAMNKLGKPFGAKVEDLKIPLSNKKYGLTVGTNNDGTFNVLVEGDAIYGEAENEGFKTEEDALKFGNEIISELKEEKTNTVQSIPVTESMKETVMEGIPLFSIKAPKFEPATQSKLDAIEKKYNETEYKASAIEFGISDKGNTFGTALDKNVHHELIAEYLKEGFNGLGYTYKTGSEPIIYHAKSGTIYVEAAGREIRISDHIGRGGIFTPTNDIYNLNQAKEILAKTKTYKEVEASDKLNREKSKAEHDILVAFNDELKERGLGYKVNNRTYQSIEEFIKGKNGIIDIKTTVLNNGAFRYEYLAPIDSYTSFAPKSYMDWYNSSDDPRFSIKAPKFESGASLKEMVTTSNMFIAARADKYGAKGRRMVESEIKTVGRAISEQSANLKESANLVTSMVKALLNNGSMNNMTRAELSQILTNVRNASNKKDLTKEFDKISSIVRQIQLRNAKRRFNDLMKFKVQDKNAKGISIASTVDDETVSIITTIRKSLKELTLEDVENQINEINNLDKKTTSDETKLVGLGIARDYMNEIKTREAQLSELSEELSKAKEDLVGKKGEERVPNKELVDSIENMVGQVKSEMTSAYDDLSARLNKIIAEGKEVLKNIKLQDKERVATLSHFVNSDMKGIEPKNNPEKGRTFKQWLKSNLIISPLQSFDFILRSLAPNQVAGNGYLHDHFSRGILSASQNAYEGTESAFKMIDEAVAKIFGNKFTFRYISARDFKKMSKYELTYGTEKSSTTITATNGQLAYIYAVNKMTDGAMKLRAMGISEEQVEEMKAALPVRIVKLVDAIQDEILPKLRVKYNNAHLEIFNTSMASIENYFPLHIDKTALTQKVDLEEESNKLSGLIKNSTKSIIKRTVNTKPIDIRNSDFSDILTDHIKDMEQWAAFASIRRDMNTLLSNRNFLNRLIELGGFEYMVQFKRAAAIAVDVYQPLSDSYDTAITGVARTVATSKVMLNLYTAFKQVLSVVAYLTEPSPKFQGKVLVNLAKGHASFKWAKDNLPDFRKRWESSALGDEKLSRQFANIASEGDFVKFMDASQKVAQKYGMYPNKMVDSYICAVGAKSLYETNYDKYISMGATEEKARERALVDAVNLYNTTQQSSESMFVSSAQLDRTFFSTAYTVFNNSSLAYNRQVFDAARNLKNAFNNRANLIENRTKFNMRTFNVSEEAAKKAATKEVDTQIMRDVLRLAVFGYGVQLIWRLGASFPYLLFGDDDDKKKKIVKEAATGGALITPIRGLLFGATFESFIDAAMFSDNMNMALDRLTGNIHPVISDVDQLAKAAFSKSLTLGKAGYLLVNLFTKLGFGIDLKAFSNATYGFVELMDSDELTANDVLIDIMSMLSVPQSQLKALALDNPETFFDRYIELKELVDYGLLAPVLELNPDDLDNYIKSGRRYMSRDMKEKVEK